MLELRINGKQADIKEESIIAITKQYESVNNPLNYYADWSKTVTLPISANNNAIFSNFNRLDSTVTNISIDPTKKIPCMILNNQEPVLEGYCKLENANTIWTDEKYEITIYSTFGLVMNELKLLTFNKNAVDVDEKYIIDSPLSDNLVIDRNLVKQSFEQQNHFLTGGNITDWIGFIPTYQGKYSEFSSDKEQILPNGRTEDMSRERDEHYTREFRSYYQQPFIWVDKLWKVAKDKIEQITDYTLNLDRSWFTGSNPYYKDLIYTCPSLFTSDNNYRQSTENYADVRNTLMINKPSKNPALSTHSLYHLNSLSSTNANIYDPVTGIFNANSDFGSTKFKGRFRFTLFASIPGDPLDGYLYCKITDDNPFYVKIKAVNADTGQEIYGAKKTFLLYSDDYDVNGNSFDEGIDLGICKYSNMGVNFTDSDGNYYFPMINHTGYQGGRNHAWQCNLDFELNIAENVPYKVYVEVWNANNGDPFEYTKIFSGITWAWLWEDDFNTSYGNGDKGYSMYFDTINVSCETTENLRSGSSISLYRVFPKDVTLCDVLLNYSKMFGLVWDVNEFDKTITVMTRNRFFNDYRIVDWTDRVDRSKEFKFSPLTFDKRYVEFNFEDGECGRLKKYESTYQVSYGSKKLDTGFEFNSDTNELMENLTPSVVCQKRQYSCMMNTEYEDRPNFMGYSYMVYPNEHYVDNDDEGSNAGMAGAFYFRNGTFKPDERLSHWDVNGNYVIQITDDTEHMIQTQEFCWNSCGEGSVLCYRIPDVSTISKLYNGKRYSVHFESPKEYYFETPADGTVNYVYKSFWENYINERYCSQNKKLTAYLYITIDEFKDIDFREFVKIDNILYHIDKIYDYNFNSYSPVKMDLVQVWDLSAYTDGQDEVPYLFTVPAEYAVTTTSQTIPVYTSYSAYHVARQPDWVTTSIDSSGNLVIRANGNTHEYRGGLVILAAGSSSTLADVLRNGWWISISQVPVNPYRLEVDRNTLVFDSWGGTQTITVDCHDTSNDAIAVASNRNWITARIREYTETASRRRDCLHLEVTALPRRSTQARNGIVVLSITAGGNTYTQTINIGQQGGSRHTRDDNSRLITDADSELVVYDANNNAVTTLISGQTYHFSDLFPDEVDINSIQITGGGSVNISGSVGMQTIEFIPQLSSGEETGGGMITVSTLDGNIVSYAYNVEAQGVAPEKRRIIVKADENSLFKIEASPSAMQPVTVNYYEDDFVDGTVITLTAMPNRGYTFKNWIDQDSITYNTETVSFKVSSSIVDRDNRYSLKLNSMQASGTTSTITIDGSGLLGVNDYIQLDLDEAEVAVVPYGEIKTIDVNNGTYFCKLTCVTNGGATFRNWYIADRSNRSNPYVNQSWTVNQNIVIKVVCNAATMYNVSVSAGSNGTVSVNGTTGNYSQSVAQGTVLTLAATPSTNYQFTQWSDGNTNASRSITVNGNITLTAAFAAIMHTVSISAGSNGTVSVNGTTGNYSQSVQQGTVLTIQANPNTNYEFTQWSDGNTNNPRTLTVTGNTTLTAAFINLMEKSYFFIEDVSGEDNTVTIYNFNSSPAIEVFKSEDGTNWESMGITSTTGITATVPANSRLYLKATADCWGKKTYPNSFKASGNHNVGGNIMSLLYGDNFENQTSFPTGSTSNFVYLFDNDTTLVSAADLVLPATILTERCYEQMFKNCTSLKQTPALPATTLATECYVGMFGGCTSLTQAPALPATTLATECYIGMFSDCTSLTQAPALPATKLVRYCYNAMFSDCTSLNKVTTYATDISAMGCLDYWLDGVSSAGDFYNLGGVPYPSGASGIPSGWTEHTSL